MGRERRRAPGGPPAAGDPGGGTEPPGVRDRYAAHPGGAAGYYADAGAGYRNPHEAGVRAAVAACLPWIGVPPASLRAHDLACGSGEVTLALRDAGVPLAQISASDPYTGEAYRARIGRLPLRRSFEEIAQGGLPGPEAPGGQDARGDGPGGIGGAEDVIFCSFALHLCPPSWLPPLLGALASRAPRLVVLTPHKKPEILPSWGWTLDEEDYDPRTRVRVRRYRQGRPQ